MMVGGLCFVLRSQVFTSKPTMKGLSASHALWCHFGVVMHEHTSVEGEKGSARSRTNFGLAPNKNKQSHQ